ncbi:MAG: hypothetical protein US95_C0005G0018 [Candidatus Woesebacteria bacterium GW2011_GWB1_38_5]|uniref:Uncharacterized protein n=3 Tax=Candidatus Woeseibacteriota TaxID=1752722 RepID=A0A0G0KIL6_9BACT|nr:MAG: hypothetical protein US75_C0029G0002 [Candidatus Woesebacteria bacterium GW2011_GWC1_38_13]KKQ75365.1 MAG: hypothetical protein US95_C0005G0018 [Candidatus Woesebacteria bacterium GW2011_GWB1_38_5]KKQ83353.1 MAG: hypothetical protein UT06_C0023G0017 [Candidatus Woesebacteria bacterium GW2011_GWA1_38_8]
MESDKSLQDSSKQFKLDLEQIYLKAEGSYKKLIEERPEALPYTAFVSELANSDCDHAQTLKALLVIAPKLTNIDGIQPPFDSTNLINGEEELLKQTVKNLSRLGLNITTDDLIINLENDHKFQEIRNKHGFGSANIIQIAEKLQEESANVLRATRTFEGARIILKKHAPKIPIPKQESLMYFRSRNDKNGGWGLRKNGGHILSIDDYGFDAYITLNDVKEKELTDKEFCISTFVIAAHELSHGAFVELYDMETVRESFRKSRGKSTNLRRAISEGYAILNESLMIEIIEEIASPEESQFFIASQSRKNHLKESIDDPNNRVYINGYKLV